MKYLNKYDTEQKLLSSPVFDPAVTKSVSDNIEIVFHDEYIKSTRWLKFSLTRDNNNVVGLVQDTTNLVIEKKKIEYERDYDVTTGLFNRRAFYDKIEELFSEPDKLGVAAFLMWDLDNLKYVNDTYGHDFGDDYIKTAANVFKLFKISSCKMNLNNEYGKLSSFSYFHVSNHFVLNFSLFKFCSIVFIKQLLPLPHEPYIAIKLFFDNNSSFASNSKKLHIDTALLYVPYISFDSSISFTCSIISFIFNYVLYSFFYFCFI